MIVGAKQGETVTEKYNCAWTFVFSGKEHFPCKAGILRLLGSSCRSQSRHLPKYTSYSLNFILVSHGRGTQTPMGPSFQGHKAVVAPTSSFPLDQELSDG